MRVLHLRALVCFLPQRREDPLRSLALHLYRDHAGSHFRTHSGLSSDRAMVNRTAYRTADVKVWSKIWDWL
jgi:hypothetical protein